MDCTCFTRRWTGKAPTLCWSRISIKPVSVVGWISTDIRKCGDVFRKHRSLWSRLSHAYQQPLCTWPDRVRGDDLVLRGGSVLNAGLDASPDDGGLLSRELKLSLDSALDVAMAPVGA